MSTRQDGCSCGDASGEPQVLAMITLRGERSLAPLLLMVAALAVAAG
jgi:hypothetical protein